MRRRLERRGVGRGSEEEGRGGERKKREEWRKDTEREREAGRGENGGESLEEQGAKERRGGKGE